MLKLKMLLFLVLAVTVGGVYASWSFPTQVNTLNDSAQMSMEIYTEPDSGMIESFTATAQSTRVFLCQGSDNRVSMDASGGPFYLSAQLKEDAVYDASVNSIAVYATITSINIANYTYKNTTLFTWNRSELLVGDVVFTDGSWSGEFYASDVISNINCTAIVETYDDFQEFQACIGSGANVEVQFTIREKV